MCCLRLTGLSRINVGRAIEISVISAVVRGLRITIVLSLVLIYRCRSVVLFGRVSILVGWGPRISCWQMSRLLSECYVYWSRTGSYLMSPCLLTLIYVRVVYRTRIGAAQVRTTLLFRHSENISIIVLRLIMMSRKLDSLSSMLCPDSWENPIGARLVLAFRFAAASTVLYF